MDCPNCGKTLRGHDRAGVKIDFCAACKGVWLDRGELDKIIVIELGDDDGRGVEARNAENVREARYRDDDDDRRSGEPKKSKKSSFFGSLTEMLGGEE